MIDIDPAPGKWFISEAWSQPDAAKAWGLSWDKWQAESTEGKGVMLAYHRSIRRMENWEHQESERKAAIRRAARGNK